MRKQTSVVWVAWLCCVFTAVAGEVDLLIGDLAGGNESARVAARQTLSRHGVSALPKLIPLLGHEDQGVSKTAYNVLSDIVNQLAGQGKETDRVAAATALLNAVDSAPSVPVLFRLLDLVAVATPEGQDIAPVAALLSSDDPQVRERARYSLETMNTQEARRALATALPGADPGFQGAILDSLRALRDPEIAPALIPYLTGGDLTVRLAAARALAWTGSPGLAGPMRQLRADAESAGPDAYFQATDAFLMLADAMAANGGNWDFAMGLFKEVLDIRGMDKGRSGLRCAAMAGLGRFGDETAVPVLIAAANRAYGEGAEAAQPDPAMADALVMAFESLAGATVAEAMAAAYPDTPERSRYGLIQAFGRRRDPRFVPVIAQELANSDAALRQAALHALADCGSADALAPLVEAASTGPEEQRGLALEAALRLADGMVASGQGTDAGKAYLRLYELAQNDDVRRKALEGLARFPIAEAHDIAMTALDSEALHDAAAHALSQLFGPLVRAGEEAKAMALFERIAQEDPSPDRLFALAAQLEGATTSLDTTRLLGVLRAWRIIGPFKGGKEGDWETPYVGEPEIDLTATYAHEGDYLEWKPVTVPNATGMVDLLGLLGTVEASFAYAYAEFDVPEAGAGQIRAGSDDGNAIWLNGEKVWQNPVDRGAQLDQDIIDVQFRQGRNTILVKIGQYLGGWGFCVRLTQPNGLPLAFAPVPLDAMTGTSETE